MSRQPLAESKFSLFRYFLNLERCQFAAKLVSIITVSSSQHGMSSRKKEMKFYWAFTKLVCVCATAIITVNESTRNYRIIYKFTWSINRKSLTQAKQNQDWNYFSTWLAAGCIGPVTGGDYCDCASPLSTRLLQKNTPEKVFSWLYKNINK